MKDYPFFKLYIAQFQRDILGMSVEQIGQYTLDIINSWMDGNSSKMPPWLSDEYDKLQAKSVKLAENGRKGGKAKASKSQAKASNCLANPSREEKSREEKRRVDNTNTRKKFVPPTISEARAYASEKNYDTFDVDLWFRIRNDNEWVKTNGVKVKSWKRDMTNAFGYGSFVKKVTPKPETLDDIALRMTMVTK